ncbi:MAG: hypothetical protein ACPGVU_13095 [Limisphaerales bacterium]
MSVHANAKIRGLALVSELNCGNCHDLPSPRGAPNLREGWLPAEYLRDFIADPQRAKPGTVMPHSLSHLAATERHKLANELTHFLYSIAKARPIEKVSRGSAEKGRELYATIGCVACHGTEPMSVSAKYTLSSLTSYLKNPLQHRPTGRMPDMKLGHFEAVNLATYLLKEPIAHGLLELNLALAKKGQKHFRDQGCVRCHQTAVTKREQPMTPIGNLDRGCLSTAKGPWPNYALTGEQRADIRTAIRDRAALSADEQIRLHLTRLNCIACHSRGEFGGPGDGLDKHFTGADPNLGDQGRIPPHLTHTGAKLKPEWLRKVLVNGESVRPYLNTRMPKFGATNVEPLIRLFAEADHLEPIQIDRVKDTKQVKNDGRQLAGSRGGLNCVACHTFRLESAAPIKALDLTTMTDRLQEQWFHQYLLHPQRFQPLTIMPGFWPEGKATLKTVLNGNTSQQIDALWQYLSYGRNVRAPAGIILEPLPLVVKDEAVMLRRNYQGIGKRGIGVGYPAKINLAFDAGQMRLAAIWRGDFVETSPAWRGQGSGAVRMMSRDIARFPVGAAFAQLENSQSAWPTNQSRQLPGFQFKGYTLDEKQRPTFRYEFQGNLITDRFIDRKNDQGKAYFERRLVLQKAVDDLYFLAGEDMKILRIHSEFPPINRGQEVLFNLSDKKELKLEYHLLK